MNEGRNGRYHADQLWELVWKDKDTGKEDRMKVRARTPDGSKRVIIAMGHELLSAEKVDG